MVEHFEREADLAMKEYPEKSLVQEMRGHSEGELVLRKGRAPER